MYNTIHKVSDGGKWYSNRNYLLDYENAQNKLIIEIKTMWKALIVTNTSLQSDRGQLDQSPILICIGRRKKNTGRSI